MALIIGDNFSYKGKKPLDDRLVTQSLVTLLAIPDYTVYDGIQVYVTTEKQFYVFNSTNTVDPTTGKWRPFEAGSSSLPSTLRYSKVFTADVNAQEDILVADTNVTAIADIKVNQFINDVAGIIAKVDSIDTTNNKIKITVLSKDTIVENDVIEYTKVFDAEINKVQTINYADVDTTDLIADFDVNHLLYDAEGTLVKILSKDTTNNTLNVVPVSVDIAISTNRTYLYDQLKALDSEINKTYNINFADISPVTLITDVEKNQFVYDVKGTLAKVDSVDIATNLITVTTITSATDKSVEAYKYLGANSLNKIAGTLNPIDYTDLDTTKLLNDIKVGELVYDLDGTLARITVVDIPSSQVLAQTITASGMPYAPLLKELVIKDPGNGYSVNQIIQSSTTGIFGEITSVGPNGEITGINNTTATAATTTNVTATVDYDTVIYGAFGKSWTPLSNSSASVSQIVSEPFEYETGFNYEITAAGSNYNVGDIIVAGSGFAEVTKISATNGIEEVKYSRATSPSTLGSGVNMNITPSTDVFIIPDLVWNNSKRNSFELTNDDGASVEFNRLDGITERCAAGEGSIYKFIFDDLNGAIYQEKTEIDSNGGGIGTFIPQKNYKKDDVIINDNIIYICKDDHTAATSLGGDIIHWKEMRKQMTSGMRSVRANITNQAVPENVFNAMTIAYSDGDQTMINTTNNCLVAPVDGLYHIHVDCVGTTTTHSVLKTAVTKTNVVSNNAYSLTDRINVSTTANTDVTRYLEAGSELYFSMRGSVASNVDLTNYQPYFELTLLTDDRSDNLLAEATLAFSNQEANISKTMKFTDSSNPSIISNDGIITLPEDGYYLLAQDLSLMTTTAADHTILTRLLKGSAVIHDYQSTGAQSKYSNSYVFILSGLKGDTFSVDNRTSIVLNNRTLANDPKIRLFKIKSVDYHIDSHDLYKDSGSALSYEDWVADKLKNEQLTVTVKPTYDQSFTTASMTIKTYTYVSGESSMFKENIKFVAPVPGLYNLNVNPVAKNTSLSKSFAIIKKNNTDTSWDYGISLIESTSTAWTGSISTNVWLEKDDYLTVGYRSNEGSFNIIQQPTLIDTATFTLINVGITSNYEVGKPHLWPVNTEIDLGDGLYGRRYKVTQTNASTRSGIITVLDSNNNSLAGIKIVSWGGSCTGYNGLHWALPMAWVSCSATLYKSFDTSLDMVFTGDMSAGQKLTNLDIWLTYTK